MNPILSTFAEILDQYRQTGLVCEDTTRNPPRRRPHGVATHPPTLVAASLRRLSGLGRHQFGRQL